MKRIHIILFLLLATLASAQDIQEVLEQDVCFCLDKQMKSKLNPKSTLILKTCLQSKIWHYPSEFKSILKEEHFIEYNADNLYKYDINVTNLGLFIEGHLDFFIQECDIYYLYISATRIQELFDWKTYNWAKTTEDLTKQIKKTRKKRKTELYYERGMKYLAIGEYENAKQDFYKFLDKYPNDEKATYALGWACELNEEYGVAMGWYKQVIKNNNHHRESITGLEIIKRKLKDKEKFEEQKLRRGYTILMNALANKDEKKAPEIYSAPVIQGCEGLTDQNEIKRCMSEVVKKHVNENFNVAIIFDYSNLKSGIHTIHTAFKISKEGKITDIRVLIDNPFAIHEVKRVISSIPPILKPGMSTEGKPVAVFYSLPIKFLISN